MFETNCLIRFKEPALLPLLMRAVKVETHGDHLVILGSDGQLCGLFLREVVKDCLDVDTLEPTDDRTSSSKRGDSEKRSEM
jgi:hypothetical protein